jgi:hypothetical protein
MEPERRIEKLLRAFAKKRREQAGDPIQLHSARRQQLQKEIARRSEPTGSGGWFSSFFPGLRPRLVFAVCFIALAMAALILWPSLSHRKPGPSLASANYPRTELAQAKKTPPPATPPPVSAVAPPTVAADKDVIQNKPPSISETRALKQEQSLVAGENRTAAVLPEEKSRQADDITNGAAQFDAFTGVSVASAAPSNNETLAFKSNGGVGGGAGAVGAMSKNTAGQSLPQSTAPTGATFAANIHSEKNLKTQAATAAPPPASAAFFDQRKNEIAAAEPAVSRLFLNRLDSPVTRQRPIDSLTTPASVLTSFRVEQTGNAMRIIDADGSVYTGAVQVAQQESVARAVPPKNAPSAAPMAKIAGRPQAGQNYSFQVAGTNRNLQQNVVFSGNVIPLTNGQLATDGAASGGIAGARRASQLPAELLLSNSRISGKAVIGNQKEIEVNATPAP